MIREISDGFVIPVVFDKYKTNNSIPKCAIELKVCGLATPGKTSEKILIANFGEAKISESAQNLRYLMVSQSPYEA